MCNAALEKHVVQYPQKETTLKDLHSNSLVTFKVEQFLSQLDNSNSKESVEDDKTKKKSTRSRSGKASKLTSSVVNPQLYSPTAIWVCRMFQRTKTRWSHISWIYCKICRAPFSKGVPSHHKNFASALFIYPLWCIWLHSLLALQSEIFTWPCVLKLNVFGLTGEIAYSFGVKEPSRSS